MDDLGHSKLTQQGPKPVSFAEASIKKSNTEATKSSENLDESVVMLFKTQTCPNCKIAGALLDKAGVSYKIMDATEHPELVEKFGIMQAPTLVIASDDSFQKVPGLSDIKTWIQNTHVS